LSAALPLTAEKRLLALGGHARMPSSANVIVLRAVGVVLLAVGALIWFLAMAFGRDLGMAGGAVAGGVSAAAALGGRSLYMRSRRLALPKDAAVPPIKGAVVYLRSFGEDLKGQQGVTTGIAYGATGLITEEEQLVESLSSVGPVIAVGEPNERLPALGAARLHFEQEEWRRGVLALLHEASLIVIRPGPFSPGVRWEIQQVLKRAEPERLVLIVDGAPGKRQDSDLAEFAARFNSLLPRPLPATYGRAKLYRLGTIRAFVCFGDDWIPTLLPVTVGLVPFLRRAVRRRLAPYYKEALRPVLTRLGCPPAPPPLSAAMVGISAGMGLVFLLLAVEAVIGLFFS
jgi:hypothetical protein